MRTAYPVLRSVLRPEFAESSDAFIESVVYRHYAGTMDAAEAEEFLQGLARSLGQFGRSIASVAQQAAPHLLNALPGALSGAATGATLGPWGALAGAALGGITSAIGSAQAGTTAGPGRIPAPPAPPLTPPLQPISVPPSLGAGGLPPSLPAPTPGISPVGQVAGLLARPEVQQALLSQLMGALGRPNISVGGMQVPTSAVMNLLGNLLQRAAQPGGTGAEDESVPAYLLDGHGRPRVDLGSTEARADALLEWFHTNPASTPVIHPASPVLSASWQAGWGEGFGAIDDAFEDDAFGEAPDALLGEGIDETYGAVPLTYSAQDLHGYAG